MPERVKRLVFCRGDEIRIRAVFVYIVKTVKKGHVYVLHNVVAFGGCAENFENGEIHRFFCKVVKFVEISGFTLFQPFYERVYFFVP